MLVLTTQEEAQIDLIKKYNKNEIHIAFVGEISAGKSSLLNSLLGLNL